MEIREITSKSIWDKFVISCPDYTFLQSWAWGEFNLLRGEKVWRLGIYDNSKLLGVCQVLTVTAKRGNFLFVPHGPLPELKKRAFEKLVRFLVDLCQKNNLTFLRISPWLENVDKNKRLFQEFGFRPAPTIMHTEETWLLPLDESEEKILAAMRKTHRNLIRRAERDGVAVSSSDETTDIKNLYELELEAAKRHDFVPFGLSYLEDEFSTFAKYDQTKLYLGRYQGELLATALIIFYGRFAFYFQSGSRQTNVPVNYLLQWEVIKEAKRRGCQLYNFWGVSAENKSNEKGLMMFKSGFGGYQKNYLHAQDLVVSSRYWLTNVVERIPRAWRAKLRFG